MGASQEAKVRGQWVRGLSAVSRQVDQPGAFRRTLGIKGAGLKGLGKQPGIESPRGQANPKEPLQAAITPSLLPAFTLLVTSLPKAYPIKTTSAVTWGGGTGGSPLDLSCNSAQPSQRGTWNECAEKQPRPSGTP